MMHTPPQGELKRGWRVVIGAALGYATGSQALPFYTLSTLMLPLGEAFGWTRSQISAVTLLTLLANLIALPLIGTLADRFGARRVGLTSLALSAVGYLAFVAVSGDIIVFYSIWLGMMVLGAGTSPAVWMRGVVSWFERRRGLAIGLTAVGAGLSGTVAPPLVEAAVRASDWRGGFILMAVLAGAIAFPITYATFHERTRAATLSITAATAAATGASLRQAVRSRHFWQLALALLLTGATVSAFIIHLVALLGDDGVARTQAVLLASLLGVAIMAGRLTIGWLVDVLFAPYVAATTFFFSALALALIASGWIASTPVFLGICIALIGLSVGAEGDLVSFLTARYFGMRSFSAICAWMIVAYSFGQGLAPLGAAALRDSTGSYFTPLLIGCASLLLSVALFASLGRYPREYEHHS
ncbi:MAG: MFS transporter [Steroidobacteraceae bacterium]